MRALFAVVLVGCSSPKPGRDVPDTAVDVSLEAVSVMDSATCGCAAYAEPGSLGTIGSTAIDELSGLAVSRAHPGVIWAHNDSGDTPRLFAIGDAGAHLGEVAINGATAVDWEDIALGPCAAGSCLFIGDIGDNAMSRTNLAVYRVAEPNVDGKPFATLRANAEKLPFAYPDGRWNAEALLVHPTTGEMVIVTKGTSPTIYRFPTPLTPGVTATLVRVGALAGVGDVVTGGDVSPCGDRVLLRTYNSLLEFRGATAADALLGAPTRVPVAMEAQGEAVSYRSDGRGYFTASEGSSVSLHATACK